MDPDWNVDAHRSEHEPEEQWEVRRAFLVEHSSQFPEDELLSLAQLFTNIEFLGCRYPKETMERIEKLSQKVAAKYREKKKSKLKRTFIQASDAAQQKAKRTFK